VLILPTFDNQLFSVVCFSILWQNEIGKKLLKIKYRSKKSKNWNHKIKLLIIKMLKNGMIKKLSRINKKDEKWIADYEN